MIRNLAVLAAEGDSPAGDLIRQNDTLAGALCIGFVIVVALLLLNRKGK